MNHILYIMARLLHILITDIIRQCIHVYIQQALVSVFFNFIFWLCIATQVTTTYIYGKICLVRYTGLRILYPFICGTQDVLCEGDVLIPVTEYTTRTVTCLAPRIYI